VPKLRPAADTGALAAGERAGRAANIERIGVERGPRSPDGLHVALKIAITCRAESVIKHTPFAVTLKQEPLSTIHILTLFTFDDVPTIGHGRRSRVYNCDNIPTTFLFGEYLYKQ